jgi:putative oligomerization/nucleic acid binding protein
MMIGEKDNRSELERIREHTENQMTMVSDQIRKLSGLRDEGLLTEEEFTAKKTELLSRL